MLTLAVEHLNGITIFLVRVESVWISPVLFVYLPDDGHLDCFYFGTIINSERLHPGLLRTVFTCLAIA